MKKKIPYAKHEKDCQKLVRGIYNSGKFAEAYDIAKKYSRQHPASLFGKFIHAAMAGDYADDITLPQKKRDLLRKTAKRLIKQVYEHPALERYEFCNHACNEYFWFHQLHEEQYAFGAKLVARGVKRGYYSMCVGSSEFGRKLLMEKKELESARAWAVKSVAAFKEFEKFDPSWHNINHFYAYALAVLGKYKAAIAAYRNMYRKQNAPVRKDQMAEFTKNLEAIKGKRGCLV